MLIAYEAGYRVRVGEKVSIDAAVFYNDYSRLRSNELELASLLLISRLTADPSSAPPPPITLFNSLGDKLAGETYGGELSLNAQVKPAWRVRATFSLLRMHLRAEAGSTDFVTAQSFPGVNARHQATFWSQHDLGGSWHLDWLLRYSDRLPFAAVPARTELDVRLAWRPSERWEISLAGQNLLSPHRPEFIPVNLITPRSEVSRRGYLELRYDY